MSLFDIFKKNEDTTKEIANDEHIHSNLVTLIILDGLGVHPDSLGNAVLQARTPFLDTVWTKAKSTLIHASGTHVGLPEFEPGNSEVGHLSIGSGQVIYQSLPRINDAIASGEFSQIDEIKKAFEEVKKRGTKMHLMGILTTAGVHGHLEHLFALLKVAKTYGVNPYLHLMTDGRDAPPTDGYFFLSKLVQKMKELGVGKISTLMGRFYGMDRDSRWDRTQKAYDAMTGNSSKTSTDVFTVLQDAYKAGDDDQILTPTTIVTPDGVPVGAIEENDIVVFFNFREDRARQITKAFVVNDFNGFERKSSFKNIYFVTMTGYSEDLQTRVIFPPKKVHNTLSNTISQAGLNQLHVSETEKFMHITYFFNGGLEKEHSKEEFFNIPSPKVFDYSKVPEMSSYIIRDEVVNRLSNQSKHKYSFIVINLANPDMVGHTGKLQAGIKACEVVDECAKDIVLKTLECGGSAIIIADHGNCETMINRVTLKPDIAHTNNPVPFILVSKKEETIVKQGEKVEKVGTGQKATPTGILADVAPTILSILNINKGEDMTGIDLQNIVK